MARRKSHSLVEQGTFRVVAIDRKRIEISPRHCATYSLERRGVSYSLLPLFQELRSHLSLA